MRTLFDKWVYKHNADNSARFVLGEQGDKSLVCIGVNPSTATPDKLDATLRRVRKFSERLGFDGWLMLNLYPQRAKDPDALHAEQDGALSWDQMTAVHEACSLAPESYTVWAAWGVLIEKRDYLKVGLEFYAGYFSKSRWISLGDVTKAGHPRHPLYLPGNAPANDFDVKEYLKGLL